MVKANCLRQSAIVDRVSTAPITETDRTFQGFLVARRTLAGILPSAASWGVLFGLFVASSALSYAGIYKTQADRDSLAAAFGANVSTSALFGPAPKLQTVAGFTVYKVWLTVAIIGGVWGLLSSTKVLRGDEDSGRWELLLSGATTRRQATFQVLVGLFGGVIVLWVATAVLTVATGSMPQFNVGVRPALFLALTLVTSALMFMAVGALTSQFGASRRQAAAYGGWILGISYALRMVADSGTGLHWLIWVSPLGWVEMLHPLTSPTPVSLLPIFGFTVLLGYLSIELAGRRDVAASLIEERFYSSPHLALLSGQRGLALRMLRPIIASWGTAIAAVGVLFGYVAYAAGETLSKSSMQAIYSRLGASGSGIKSFLGVSFLMLAVMLSFVAVGQLTAARAEEAGGRLDQLLARPVTRVGWLAGRLAIALVFLIALGILAGVASWLGVAINSPGFAVAVMIVAGLNIVAPAVCVLGLSTLAFGVLPRATSIVGYGIVTWSLLMEFVGGIGALNHWIFDTSLFHQMSAAPAVGPNAVSDFWMIAIGVAAAVAGCVVFARRDIQGA